MNSVIKSLSLPLVLAAAGSAIWMSYPQARSDTDAAGFASQLHLSWTLEPSRTLTVTWHTPTNANSAIVEYRVPVSRAWTKQEGSTRASPGRGFLHTVTIAGLEPATEYEYRVSNDNGVQPLMSDVSLTRTASDDPTSEFRVAFISDTGIAGRLDGNANGTNAVIDEIVADDPLFILGGGDYAYANFDPRFASVGDAIDTWFVQMEPLFARMPFMAQYGNHEVSLVEDFADWAPRFALPSGSSSGPDRIFDVAQAMEDEMSYSFDVGPVHFTGLFVPQPYVEPERLIWLDRDLAAARDGGAQWLVVYQHEPVFGHGYVHPADPRVRESLTPILEKHAVDVHLSAHDQSYERTFPLTGLPEHLEIGSRSGHDYVAGEGVVYMKVSPSGKMSERQGEFSRFRGDQPEFIAARDDTLHHYALITVRGQKELLVEVFGVTGNDEPKRLVDRFSIRRAASRAGETARHD